MLHLPVPNPEPLFVRVFNPVFLDPFTGWDILKSGEIIGRAPTLHELDCQLTPEREGLFEEWHAVAPYRVDAVWSEKHGGAILEGHEELGFSFLTLWLVPPDLDFVVRRLLEICEAEPRYWKGWHATDGLEVSALNRDYLDLMQPVFHHDPAAREQHGSSLEFYQKVYEGISAAADAWKADQG